MIKFSTEFPLNDKCNIEDILKISCEWIAGSPYSKLELDKILPLTQDPEKIISNGEEEITICRADMQEYETGGFKYKRIENDELVWTTTIVASQNPSQHLISIQVECESFRTSKNLPDSKKPYLIKQIFEKIGGGLDGNLIVSDEPIILKEGEESFASEIIYGELRNELPIVYISHPSSDREKVDHIKLAQWLSGMAHVVVEPSRIFSERLKNISNGYNVYGGTVGVYWPDSTAKKSYFISDLCSSIDELMRALTKDVKYALANRRLRTQCNWLHLKECVSRIKINNLKSSDSNQLTDFIDAFDEEIETKDKIIQEAESEILRLKAELRRPANTIDNHGVPILTYGNERDLYQDEIKTFIIEALIDKIPNTIENSRRRHIIEDVISQNPLDITQENQREQIKNILKQYKNMDAKTRTKLKDFGFEIEDDSKHHTLTFFGDSRYVFVASKSSSDHRAGQNLASDINKKLF